MNATGVQDVSSLVDQVIREPPRRDELVPLLDEGHAVYDGLGESLAARVRGWVMASFGTVGLPAEAVPAVVETLTTTDDAFALAAAARATRGSAASTPELTRALVTAVERFHLRDDSVSFTDLRGTWSGEATTAVTEALAALQLFGPSAHSAHHALTELEAHQARRWSPALRRRLSEAISAVARAPLVALEPEPDPPAADVVDPPAPLPATALRAVVEDQDGVRSSLGDRLRPVPHVVAFFYTRCSNPRKCSATVTRLGQLQSRLASEGLERRVGIAAITYDPGYDSPERMRAYGSARGMRFGPTVTMLRFVPGRVTVRDVFDLKVGYSESVVNQHAIELVLVDTEPAVRLRWSRTEWDVDEVVASVTRFVVRPPGRPSRAPR